MPSLLFVWRCVCKANTFQCIQDSRFRHFATSLHFCHTWSHLCLLDRSQTPVKRRVEVADWTIPPQRHFFQCLCSMGVHLPCPAAGQSCRGNAARCRHVAGNQLCLVFFKHGLVSLLDLGSLQQAEKSEKILQRHQMG